LIYIILLYFVDVRISPKNGMSALIFGDIILLFIFIYGLFLVFYNKKTINKIWDIDIAVSRYIPFGVSFFWIRKYGLKNLREKYEKGEVPFTGKFTYYYGFAVGLAMCGSLLFWEVWVLLNVKI
jgi:hypothetical protein